jgi:uncharacterized phage-associated protein
MNDTLEKLDDETCIDEESYTPRNTCIDMKKVNKKNGSQAVANKILEVAINDPKGNKVISKMKLMNLVYLVHGFSLALLNKEALNHDFDILTARGSGIIIEPIFSRVQKNSFDLTKTVNNIYERDGVNYESGEKISIYPNLIDNEIESIVNIVWLQFYDFSDDQLNNMIKGIGKGTPWERFYQEKKNNYILNKDLKIYFESFIRAIIDIA